MVDFAFRLQQQVEDLRKRREEDEDTLHQQEEESRKPKSLSVHIWKTVGTC